MREAAVILRKWYFASNVHGIRNAFDQIQAAVLSSRANTSLSAHFLFDDEGATLADEGRIQWLLDRGVEVIRHKASMVALLEPRFGEQMSVYGGHWLRCDIPFIERYEDYVLYTDIDVVFMKDVSIPPVVPIFLACGPEHNIDDYSYFNSGVMILNVRAFKAVSNELHALVERRLSFSPPYDDQSVLNELFFDRWERLPSSWNWKPYWGRNDSAAIVHFHGPKPTILPKMLAGDRSRFGEELQTIFERSPEGYAYYLRVLQTFG